MEKYSSYASVYILAFIIMTQETNQIIIQLEMNKKIDNKRMNELTNKI